MITLKEAVIVEGKYDKIKLSGFISADIITTDGFRIFKDKDKVLMIKRIAEKRGIIILTDSDSAGFLIRGHLAGLVPIDRITNVFVPQISGKEKRKDKASAEGYLGVEGLTEEVILAALQKAGVAVDGKARKIKATLTSNDLFRLGISGRDDSKARREALMKKLSLPIGMSTKQLLTALNSLYDYDELCELLKENYNENR